MTPRLDARPSVDRSLSAPRTWSSPGLQDELATVIRMLHGELGLDEGGVQ